MFIDNLKYLKVWISDHLKSQCRIAEPKLLANTIVSIFEEKKSETEIRQSLADNLRGVLKSNTNLFVELLFQTIETRSYMGSAYYGPDLPDTDSSPTFHSSMKGESKKSFSQENLKKDDDKDSFEMESKAGETFIDSLTYKLYLSNADDEPITKSENIQSKLDLNRFSENPFEVDIKRKDDQKATRTYDSRQSNDKPDSRSILSGGKESSKSESKSYRKKSYSSGNDSDQMSSRYRSYSPPRQSKETSKSKSKMESRSRNSRYSSNNLDQRDRSRSPNNDKLNFSKHKRNHSSDSSSSDHSSNFKRNARSSSPSRMKRQLEVKADADRKFSKTSVKGDLSTFENSWESEDELLLQGLSPKSALKHSENKKLRFCTQKIVNKVVTKESESTKRHHEEVSNDDSNLKDKDLRNRLNDKSLRKHNSDEPLKKKRLKDGTNDSLSSDEGSENDDFKPVSNRSRAVYGRCGPTSQKDMWIDDPNMYQSNENVPNFPHGAHRAKEDSKLKKQEKIRCKDFDEKGYCMLGDFCSYDHGTNPVVFDSSPNQAPLIPLPLQDSNNLRVMMPPGHGGVHLPPIMPYNPLYSAVSREQYDPERPSIAQAIGPSIFTSPGLFHNNSMMFPPYSNSMSGPMAGSEAPFCPQYITPHMNLNNFVPAQSARHHFHSSNHNTHRPSVHVNQNLISLTRREDYPKRSKHFSNRGTNLSVKERLNASTGANEDSNAKNISFNNTRALEVQNIPVGCDKIGVLNEEFSKFGTVMNIKLRFNGRPNAALVHYSKREEAEKAYEHFNSTSVDQPYNVSWFTEESTLNQSPNSSNLSSNNSLKVQSFNRRHVITNRFGNKKITNKVNETKQHPKEDLREELTKRRLLCKQKRTELLTFCVANAKAIIEKRSHATNDSEKDVFRQLLLGVASKVIELQESWTGDKPKDIQDLFHDFTSKIQKEILDAELDLYGKERQGDNIVDLSKTLNSFKEKFEILNKKSRFGVDFSKASPAVSSKRFLTKSSPAVVRKIDRRPKSFLIKYKSEFDDQNKRDELQKFLNHLQGKEEVKEIDNAYIVTFKTRRFAEEALNHTSQFWKKFCVITWFSEDSLITAMKLKEDSTENKNSQLETV